MIEKDYIKKHLILDAINAVKPSADDYDIENPDNESLQDIAYWAARDMFDDIVSIVEGATPTECKPVVHGYWKNVKRVLNTEWGECSNCDRRNDITPYCPQCGAKMGESEDNNATDRTANTRR